MEKLTLQEQKMINAGGSTLDCAAVTASGATMGAISGSAAGPIGMYGGAVANGIITGATSDVCKK